MSPDADDAGRQALQWVPVLITLLTQYLAEHTRRGMDADARCECPVCQETRIALAAAERAS